MKEPIAQLPPPPKEYKPNPLEQKLLDDVAALRRDFAEKERREEIAALVRSAREEGLKEGRAEREIDGVEGLYSSYNGRAYGNVQGLANMATTFLAGVGAEALRNGRRSRSGSRDRYRSPPRYRTSVYIQAASGEKKDSVGELLGEIRRVNDTVQYGRTVR